MENKAKGCFSEILMIIVLYVILGLIYAFTGSALLVIIGIVVSIIIVVKMHKANSKEIEENKRRNNRNKRRDYREEIEINKIDDFFERCYNHYNRTFDFYYFDTNSEPFRDPDVRYNKKTYDWFLIKQCDAGLDFIFWIKYFINEGLKTKDYTYMLSQIRAREQMLINIVYFCGGTKCPHCIIEFESEVKRLLSRQIPCNEKNLRRILGLVPVGITSDSIIHNS